jgi:hypothetical protein
MSKRLEKTGNFLRNNPILRTKCRSNDTVSRTYGLWTLTATSSPDIDDVYFITWGLQKISSIIIHKK